MRKKVNRTCLVVFAVDKGQLEFVLRLINLQDAGLGLSVKAEDLVANDLGHVNGQIDGADNAAVTVGCVATGIMKVSPSHS